MANGFDEEVNTLTFLLNMVEKYYEDRVRSVVLSEEWISLPMEGVGFLGEHAL